MVDVPYFELQCIFGLLILLVFPIHDTRYFPLSVLLIPQYFDIHYWLYCMLEVSNKQHPCIDVPFSPFAFASSLFSFSYHFGTIFPLFKLGTLLSNAFDRMVRWCVLMIAWYPDIDVFSFPFDFVSLLSAFHLYYVRIEGVPLWV